MNDSPATHTLKEAMSFTSGYCKNCKYFIVGGIDKGYGQEAPKGMGGCKNPIFYEGYHYEENANEEVFVSGAIIEDDEGE